MSLIRRLSLLPILLMVAAAFAQGPRALQVSGDVAGTHDPSMIKAAGTSYVFATGKSLDGGQFQIRCSPDLHVWRACGHVFAEVPAWIHAQSPGTGDLWAPDISYTHGVYQLYYAYSLFGKNTSGIALATNKTLNQASPDYHWVDRGLVLRSTAQDDYNATSLSMRPGITGWPSAASGAASRCAG